MIKKITTILITASLLSTVAQAQSSDKVTYSIESGITTASGSHSPLWLNANKQGLSSLNKNNGYMEAGIFQPMDTSKIISYGYGLELAGAYNFTSSFIIQQAYVDVKYHKLELSIGSKERTGEFVNPQLSSGGLTISGNARPIPQVWAGLPNYIPVPGTNHWLSFRGHIAYGRFTDDNWQKEFTTPLGKRTTDVLYHSKAMYVKIGKEEICPLKFEFGLQMESEFGGTQYSNGNMFKMPSGIEDYFKAFVPMAGGEKTQVSDQENIEGNQLGSWHFSLNYKVKGWNLHAYYEHYFEDHSMLFMQYPWKDGMAGIEITPPANPFVSGVVYEYIGSKDQSGPVYWDHNNVINEQISARDGYYDHGFYTGWQHWGMAIGNPLFTSPIYNNNGQITFTNNRIIAHHLGISGKPIPELQYRVLLSHSDNWGTYDRPFKDIKKNTSALVELTYSPCKLTGWSFTASGATDRGSLLGNNTGTMLTIRKTGLLTK
ncbi:Capsule assembly protein Wzi [Bacteroides luti]|uniref:Capsule assembly protein Wzi n=1 Tax=Bacteroides luti TaxID=1297750 RepID=A0A1M4WGD0_9BACE|nr:capsule assembly Wzi family protein [Bacteroides luti]SHE80308.1 Capsule assembly protein Wzi [Bacteroides luti]